MKKQFVLVDLGKIIPNVDDVIKITELKTYGRIIQKTKRKGNIWKVFIGFKGRGKKI